MEKLNQEQMIEQIEGWTVLELNNFVKSLETRWDVKAGAGGMMMAMPGAAADAGAAAEEQTEFDVILKDVGDKKINVIKVVRQVTSLGLKEAKDLVDGAPKPVKEGVTKEEAAELKKQFEEAGATVEIK